MLDVAHNHSASTPRTAPAVGALRIASVPAGHPYPRAIARSASLTLLDDPVEEGWAPGRWWPSIALRREWIAAHADEFDVLHVHFGTESFSPDELRQAIAALRAAGRGLVYTVHDLENPQLTDQARHVEALDVLVPAADAVVTLTPGAAAEIEQRWARRAIVLPHPHVHPLDTAVPPGRRHAETTVGVHLRDLRPNIDAVGTVERMLAAVSEVDGTRVVVRVNRSVRDEAARDAVRTVVGASPLATLVVGDRMSDTELAAWLADLDVCVLPYAHGTHSGWVELCHDVGVPVAGSRTGYAWQQHPESFFEAEPTASSLARALRAARDAAPRPGTRARRSLVARRRSQRIAEADRVGRRHAEIYAAVARGGRIG